MGPGAGWRWLSRAIDLGRHDPKALFGAAALMLVVALIPSLVQQLVLLAVGPANTHVVLGVAVAGMLAMLVVFPLLIAGFLRVIDAAENGRPTRALAVFDTFRAGNDRGRIIGTGLLLMLVYVALIALVLGVAGREVAAWYWEVLSIAQSATPGSTPALPGMPEGMGRVAGLLLLVMMISGGLYSIGFGQVALGGRTATGALADAAAGTVKNVLPLLVLTLLGLVAMVVATLVIVLVVMFLTMLGSVVHPALGLALALPVYVAFMVIMYVVMFGVMYFIWRDVTGPHGPAVQRAAIARDDHFAA
jgi:hypothetical protein